MEDYLKSTLHKLKTKNYSELNLVLGNESCDLDSAASAIVYAAFLHWQYDKIKCCKVCTRLNRDEAEYKDSIYLPVLNVDREDYALKTEVAYCLTEAGISEESLLFRNDINIKELADKNETKVTLVDHHILSEKDKFLTPYVTEIIDHRPIDKSHWCYKVDVRTTIEIVGSCSTLVAQRIRDLSALVTLEEDFFREFLVCGDILHSTIILDTVNFSKEVDKATPHDVEIASFLENLLKLTDVETARTSKLSRYVAARSDVSVLTPSQLLRKDVKLLGDIFVPSFPILVKEFLARPGASQAVAEALNKRGCTIAVLLGMDLTGALRRDMAVWSAEKENIEQLTNFLTSWQPSLDLLADMLGNKSDNELGGLRYYTQRNLRASRKQYIPALTEYLNVLK